MVPFLYVEFTFWLTLILSLHRSRDSTLRAGALTCSKMYDTWQASLLDNITISLYNIMSLNILLERNQELGELIRTLHCTKWIRPTTLPDANRWHLQARDLLRYCDPKPPSDWNLFHVCLGARTIYHSIYCKLKNLQYLAVDDAS